MTDKQKYQPAIASDDVGESNPEGMQAGNVSLSSTAKSCLQLVCNYYGSAPPNYQVHQVQQMTKHKPSLFYSIVELPHIQQFSCLPTLHYEGVGTSKKRAMGDASELSLAALLRYGALEPNVLRLDDGQMNRLQHVAATKLQDETQLLMDRRRHGAAGTQAHVPEGHLQQLLSQLDDQPVDRLQRLFSMVYSEYLRNLKQVQILHVQLQHTRDLLADVSRRAVMAAQVLQPIAAQSSEYSSNPTNPSGHAIAPERAESPSMNAALRDVGTQEAGVADLAAAINAAVNLNDREGPTQPPASSGPLTPTTSSGIPPQPHIMGGGGASSSVGGGSGSESLPGASGATRHHPGSQNDLVQQLQNALGICTFPRVSTMSPALDIRLQLQGAVAGADGDGDVELQSSTDAARELLQRASQGGWHKPPGPQG